MDRHIPTTIPTKHGKNVFMTTEAIRLKNSNYRAWKRYMARRTKHDRNAYTRLKNHHRDLTRHLRGDFERKIAANVKLKPKRFWKYARSRLKSRQGIPTLTKADGSKSTNPKDKAETLNQFFANFTYENLENIHNS